MSGSTLPITDLLRSPSRVGLLNHFLAADEDEWYRKADLIDQTDFSNTKIHEQLGGGDTLGPLVLMGVVDISDSEANMPRYKRGDTPVMAFLSEWDGPALSQFFETGATQKLTEYFLQRADPDTEYSAYRIKESTGMSYSGFRNNIERFVDAGIVATVDDDGNTRYVLQPDNETYAALATLNELLYDVYTERAADDKQAV